MKYFAFGFVVLALTSAVIAGVPSVEYLPPVGQEISEVPQLSVSSYSLPSNEYLAPGGPSFQSAAISSGVLADDGYRYKTVRRLRHRHRRDVSELPSSEYLPPTQQFSVSQSAPQVFPQYDAPQVSSVSLPSNEYLSPAGPSFQGADVSSGVLADDGYRYRTVKRYRLRHRRGVSELPSSEYLPPVEQAAPQVQYSAPQVSSISLPSNEYLAPVGPSIQSADVSSGVLADDGYRYKTVKRYRLRHRREVSELPSVDYLPPVQQQFSLPQQVSSLGPVDFSPLTSGSFSGGLSDEGYRYKTVKKIKRRH